MIKDKRRLGMIFAIVGTMFWGISGTVAQGLLQNGVTAQWLVCVRMIFAGLILVIWSFFTIERKIWQEIFSKKNFLSLVVFSIFGMIPSQFTYFKAIEAGNASTATILQFLGPLFIIIYLAFATRMLPRRIDVISIVIAILGIFLLVTDGDMNRLTLSPAALFWGIMAGVSQASYTLLPRELLKKFDARAISGLSMIVGGIVLLPFVIFQKVPEFSPKNLAALFYIIIFGTMFAYLLYLMSLKFIPPETTGMLSAFEPFTATILTIIVFHIHFGFFELLGGLLILSTTFLQSISIKRK